jgi:hypothetical protein
MNGIRPIGDSHSLLRANECRKLVLKRFNLGTQNVRAAIQDAQHGGINFRLLRQIPGSRITWKYHEFRLACHR